MASGKWIDQYPSYVPAQASRENFPVSPWFLPRRSREHLRAFYGFARLVDDLGDEAPGDRRAALDEIELDLGRVDHGTPRHPLVCALQASVRELDVPPEPLLALVHANRRDQTVTRYPTFDDLLAYCEMSANPVGHLVLYAFRAASRERFQLSDRICTALQLIEHLQDVAEDLARGRIYLPQDDLARFGCDEQDLAAPVAGEQVRRLVTFEAARASRMLDEGMPLVRDMSGRAALAVACFVAGGRAALAAIARARGDVLGNNTQPSRRGFIHALIGTWWRTNDGDRRGSRLRLVRRRDPAAGA